MKWRPDPLDFLLLVGFALTVYGVWLIFEPAAFIVGGCLMILWWVLSVVVQWLRFMHGGRAGAEEPKTDGPGG